MKNIKDIVIGIFAVFGFTAMVTGFTTNSNQEHTVPESHAWEAIIAKRQSTDDRVYLYNKITGEMRKYSSKGMTNGKLKDQYFQVMQENKEGEK